MGMYIKDYKMKRSNHFSTVFWLLLAAGLLFSLVGCGTPAALPVPTTTPFQNTPTAGTPATVRGMITYQAPPTPASMLYFIGPESWYALEVPGASPYATFEMQVAPGTYQLVAYPVGSESAEFRPAAAYTTGSGIAALTVTAGQVVEGIHVQNINSDNCVSYAFPASPDGLFPPMEETCSRLPTEIPPATLRGTITYQAPPTPALHPVLCQRRKHVSTGSACWKPGGKFRAAGGAGYLPIDGLPGWQ